MQKSAVGLYSDALRHDDRILNTTLNLSRLCSANNLVGQRVSILSDLKSSPSKWRNISCRPLALFQTPSVPILQPNTFCSFFLKRCQKKVLNFTHDYNEKEVFFNSLKLFFHTPLVVLKQIISVNRKTLRRLWSFFCSAAHPLQPYRPFCLSSIQSNHQC